MKTDLDFYTNPDVPTEAADSPRPEIISWNVTEACNLRCSHCYLAAGRAAPAELSLEEGCRLIDQFAAAGNRMLILTGGEPLMRRDIVDLAAYASSKGLMVVLGTNGMLLTPARIRQLKEAGVAGAGISLDSLDPEKHDEFRGVPGAWRGAVRGIRNCVAQDLPVLLQMTALPWNYHELPDVIEFAHRERVTGFTLYFLVCTGRGDKLSDITPDQYEEALAHVVESQQRYPEMMIRARCAPQIARVATRKNSTLVGNAGCLAARQYCRVSPEGEVTPCPYLPLVAGNVRERPFGQIWSKAPLFTQMREEAPSGRCGRCEFQQLCGGCRARAFGLTGELLGEDPWCAYEPAGPALPQQASQASVLLWTSEAMARLNRIPPFIRGRVKLAVERHAAANGCGTVTPVEMTATLEGLGRRLPFRRPGHVGGTDRPDDEGHRVDDE